MEYEWNGITTKEGEMSNLIFIETSAHSFKNNNSYFGNNISDIELKMDEKITIFVYKTIIS